MQITAGLQSVLQSIPKVDGNPYLFPSEGGKPFVNIFCAWNTARKAAGLSDVRMHDLRHTFASTLVNSGCSLYAVKELLGHSNIAVTQRYAHLSQDVLVAAANHATSLFPQLATLVAPKASVAVNR